MNSRWQMNRIGLIDFWYYDEEEFSFADGRMLLRGSNGSGKSVTMQSFIPLILDGNMRPERLDPFGSRARKMENYLLEEGDGREERTSYLYLELKRKGGNNYLTIGVGLRARRGKKLDTWYFYVNDGRRIGKDLFLYKDVDQKIACTRLELRNRIGDGGRVMDSQSEYMDVVNRLVFGFESTDKFKEMTDLLIQLRSPKLSKDFKPSVLNDILSNSLLMLSEEDLRPMSEAIENMDALKTNLDHLRESLKAAGQIGRVYDQYNQAMLRQKAEGYVAELKKQGEYQNLAESCEKEIHEMEQACENAKERHTALEEEERILREQQDSLNASDAVRLKEQETDLAAQISESQKQEQKKLRQEEEKKARWTELDYEWKELSQKKEQDLDKLNELLTESEEQMEDLPFDETSFMLRELREDPEREYDFEGHRKQLEVYRKKVEDGIKILLEEKQWQERYDQRLADVDRSREERDRAERERIQTEQLLEQKRSELTEQYYSWSRGNEELSLSEERLQTLTRAVYQFDENSDYSAIREVMRQEAHVREDQIRELLQAEKQKQKETKLALEAKREELEQVREQRELEPERIPAVEENRKRLKKLGIPSYPFYQAVDFDPGMDAQACARLEEALEQMGILDALIVPKEYREQVLRMDPGMCDRYLFGDGKKAGESILSCFSVDNPQQDILLYQQIAPVLEQIGFQMSGMDTWVEADGHYRIGALEGTVSGQKEARYIGAGTRARYRQQRIQLLEEACAVLEKEKEQADARVKIQEECLVKLKQECETFPDGMELKAAVKAFGTAVFRVSRMEELVKQARAGLDEAAKQLNEVKIQVVEVCEKAYLAPRLDLFQEAGESIGQYRDLLGRIQVGHHEYRNCCASLRTQQAALDEADADLEDIRYDLTDIRRKLSGLKERLERVRGQLQMTDYKEIRETLDHCVQRLSRIPAEKETAVWNEATLRTRIQQKQEEARENAAALLESRERVNVLEQDFRGEYELGYVPRQFTETEDLADQAQKVIRQIGKNAALRNLSDCHSLLQEKYHENRGYLLEYALQMKPVLDREEKAGLPSARRIDLVGRYRGVEMKFQDLTNKLEEEADEQERLLSDKDRELFEDILANTISKKIRSRIHESNAWVERMNQLMGQMKTSSGLKLSLKWKSLRAEKEDQLDTRDLVMLLQKDAEIMREEEVEQLSRHFRSKIAEARRQAEQGDSSISFHAVMRDILDYRKWFEFKLEYQKTGELKKELTDRAFFTFSGGEKAMSMYVPLFSAAVAKYKGAREDAPRIISLDEAFAGVDETNIRDMFRLMVDFEFDFIINSQILWGDYDTVPQIAVYQLVRPENAKFVSVIPYQWNGKERVLRTNAE